MKAKSLSFIALLAAITFVSCNNSDEQLRRRANELCRYIPDHELLERSRDYMTSDFYAVLDTMFYHLPAHEAMAHEWLYYFVTGNGGTIADYEVQTIERTDDTHAIATILVRQKWEDGSFDETSDVEEHRLYMERVNGKWLMSDFDEHKQDCIRYIANSRKEQALRDTMNEYLTNEIGVSYLQGELCIPTLMIVAAEELAPDTASVWCDCWIFWYNRSGDTLKTVSGGNHAGRMTITLQDGRLAVTDFEQTVDGTDNEQSAKRIFGTHYDVYHNIHSNADVQEAVRQEQLGEYIRRYNLDIHYYQDYGWPAVAL